MRGSSPFARQSSIEDDWKPDYSKYNTLYKEINGGVQFSDDGSVYVAPPEPEPEPEPEPYVPTLEEVKAGKKQEIAVMHQSTIASGIDVIEEHGNQKKRKGQ